MSFLMHGIITLSDATSYDKIKVEEETKGYKKKFLLKNHAIKEKKYSKS